MRKIKLYIRIAISWLKVKYKNIFYKRKMKNLQSKRLDEFKKMAPKKIASVVMPSKNLKLFAYDSEMDVVYEVLIKYGRAFVNPNHPSTWSLSYDRASKKLRK